MPEGTVKKLIAEKGFGFIKSTDGSKDYFFHCSGVAPGHDFSDLQEGTAVQFQFRQSRMKPDQQEAYSVKRTPGGLSSVSPFHAGVKPTHGQPQAKNRTTLPYGFVAIDLSRTVADVPVWHDGSCGGDLLSGEILCELEALTPLMPGNVRYKAEEADQRKLQDWGFGSVNPKKQIAEPLRLPDDRVVIAGTALKGVIRQSLGALTSAPMERVAERHFTYRPNFGHADVPVYVCRPAVVDRKEDQGWIVKVLPGARDAVFRENQKAADAVEFIYKGGIDGKGILAQSAPRKTYVYKKAWISPGKLKEARECRISKAVFDAYLETQRVLYTDHISQTHPQDFDRNEVERAIKSATEIEHGQLIYVEKKLDSDEIVSFGHHYQYRWAYTSSVRTKNGKLRPCLTPSTCEQVPKTMSNDPEVRPEKLTGARLLFGYVRDDKTNLIGKGVFERMAGRIAINHAVSDGVPSFLGEGSGYCVPLKILGQPKPSAWEFYLQQPKDTTKPLATYGDLPDDAGGELAGRKFYRHQTSVSEKDIKATTAEEINSDQATLARFVCAPGATFKFTVRFMRLRDWELGALLAVLEPHLLADDGKHERYAHKLGLGRPLGMGSVRIARKDIRVRLEREVDFLDEERKEERMEQALEKLKKRVDVQSIGAWLSAHEFVDRGRLQYPVAKTKVDGQPVETIYAWHTNVRREYSKLRRQEEADWSSLNSKIHGA